MGGLLPCVGLTIYQDIGKVDGVKFFRKLPRENCTLLLCVIRYQK